MKIFARKVAILLAVYGSALAEEQSPLAPGPVTDIPLLGFGTWNLDRSNASEAVETAFAYGYRHIDCAAIYGNEKEVGRGIANGAKRASVKREEFWVTSKLWNDHHRPDLVPKALDQTLLDLGLEYLDLYLMHWPVSQENGEQSMDYIETWKAMTKLLESGKTRRIGVSNFSPAQMTAIIPISKPYAHQLEVHPYLQQNDFVSFHEAQGIHVTAYSPLANRNPTYTSWRKEVSGNKVPPLLDNSIIKDIAEERGCTPAQVALKWGMMRGTSVIPKSRHADRIAENWESLSCNLYSSDVEKIRSSLPVKRFNNPSNSWGVKLYQGLDDAPTVVDDVNDILSGWRQKASSSVRSLWQRYAGLIHGEL